MSVFFLACRLKCPRRVSLNENMLVPGREFVVCVFAAGSGRHSTHLASHPVRMLKRREEGRMSFADFLQQGVVEWAALVAGGGWLLKKNLPRRVPQWLRTKRKVCLREGNSNGETGQKLKGITCERKQKATVDGSDHS